MRQKLAILSLALLALAAGAVFSRGGTALAASSHNDAIQGPPVAEYPGADYVNVANQTCLSDGTVQINLSWQSYNLGYQWIDLSLTNNGFAQGTFVGIGPVAPKPVRRNSRAMSAQDVPMLLIISQNCSRDVRSASDSGMRTGLRTSPHRHALTGR